MRVENMMALADSVSEDDVTYAATDPGRLNVNLDAHGSDRDMFALSSTGVLSFKERRTDYEMPTDANRDNVYEVTVRASDGTLNEDRMVRVTVTNVDEAPEIIEGGLAIAGSASVNYAENGDMDAVATFTARGPMADMAMWSLDRRRRHVLQHEHGQGRNDGPDVQECPGLRDAQGHGHERRQHQHLHGDAQCQTTARTWLPTM